LRDLRMTVVTQLVESRKRIVETASVTQGGNVELRSAARR